MATFATELTPFAIPRVFTEIAAIVPWSVWQRRIEGLKSDLKSNPLWQRFLLEQHGLELALGEVRDYFRATGRYPWPPRTAREYRLYSFVVAAVQTHRALATRGKARFAGAIRSGLEKEYGLGPLAFEMKVVVHLISRGFDIEFHDFEDGGGFDFLASQGSTRAEVECKHISADIGRQIHRRKLSALGAVLKPVLAQCVENRCDGRLVRVTLPGRLSARKEDQQILADRIGAALAGVTGEDDSACAVSVQAFSLDDSPFNAARGHGLTMEEVEEHLITTFGIESAHVILNWRPGHGAVVVHFQSQKPDRVLHKILKHLKADARRQFSGNLPALLCVHLADLTEQQLMELAREDEIGAGTGLQSATSILLQTRPHLHSVSIMTDGAVKITRQQAPNAAAMSVQETGPSYVFRNPGHPASADSLLRDFFH